ETVSALCRTFRSGAPVEDTTASLLAFDNGAICSLDSSLMAAAPSFPGEEFRFRFMGKKAVMDLDPFSELRISRNGVLVTLSTQDNVGHQSSGTLNNPARLQAYHDQAENFAAAIRGLDSEIAGGKDGRVSVAVCLAMLEASRTGTVRHLT